MSNEGQRDRKLGSETQRLREEYKYHLMACNESTPEGEMLNYM